MEGVGPFVSGRLGRQRGVITIAGSQASDQAQNKCVRGWGRAGHMAHIAGILSHGNPTGHAWQRPNRKSCTTRRVKCTPRRRYRERAWGGTRVEGRHPGHWCRVDTGQGVVFTAGQKSDGLSIIRQLTAGNPGSSACPSGTADLGELGQVSITESSL
ncbi:hypothetical protein Bbelb_203220 [Branchiostoma belcheri]|nr:hypothetical protein Bbelb_203220 [Branchiostoma belcheri]